MSDQKRSNNIEEILEKCEKIKENAENAIKATNELPSSDFVLYQSYSGFSKVMDHESKTIMQLLHSLVKDEKVKHKSLTNSTNEEKFDMIVEINDSILDRVGNLLDEAEGLKKRNDDLIVQTLNVPTYRKPKSNFTKWNERATRIKEENIKIQVIKKPQEEFEIKPDNFNIFKPFDREKYNSTNPKPILIEHYNERNEPYYLNPYEEEIKNCTLLSRYIKYDEPIKPLNFEETYFKYIDNLDGLKQLVGFLTYVNEFAVDLEYHSQRSFLGFTCLMQISTRIDDKQLEKIKKDPLIKLDDKLTKQSDYIIDTIKLRSHMYILNEVFTKPTILKIFHGADLDIRWLQKDFGIYVVNMFDTGKASKLLQFASFSLSFLVKHYCNENLVKKYQLADWRIRPLTEGMINYARSDTHSLLYIFDRLRNDLFKKDGEISIRQAFEDSRKVCLATFEVPTINENSYLALIMKNRVDFNNRQKQAFKDLYSWRDKLARVEDESLNYILPNHMMLKIAEVLPQEQQGILACCNPIPTMVKKYLAKLHSIVLKARELPLNQQSNNVYSLKPIVNQIVDITSNMDILDENVDDHHVTHDCLLDTPELRHKIKFSRKIEDNHSKLLNFFSNKLVISLNNLKDEELPFQKYSKIINIKRKEQLSMELDKDDNEIDINQVPEMISKEITHDPIKELQERELAEKERKEAELLKKMETTPLIDFNKKRKNIDQVKPDIPCEVNSSIDNLISNAMTTTTSNLNNDHKIEEAELDDDGEMESKDEDANTSNEFDYNQADYSIFSQNNQQQSKFFDPSGKFLKQKQKNRSYNSRTKRKRDYYINSAPQQNKRSK